MSLLFQFQVGGSWWTSFVRERIILQFKEESNLLFQERVSYEIYPAVQGQGGGSHPYQAVGMNMKRKTTG